MVLCLPILASCTTTETVVAPKAIVRHVPAALTQPCPPADRRPWKTTADIVASSNANEAALRACAAQVDGVRQWDEAQK